MSSPVSEERGSVYSNVLDFCFLAVRTQPDHTTPEGAKGEIPMMKRVKIFSIAAVAASALIVIVAAGEASATVGCEVTPAAGTDCPAASLVAKGTIGEFTLEPGSSAMMTGPFGELIITCTESTLKGVSTSTGSTNETAKGLVETTTYGGCNHPLTVLATGASELHYIAGTDNGTLTNTGGTAVIHEVAFFGSCQYATNATTLGTITGSTTKAPTFDIAAKVTSENGCPNGTLEGSYVYTGTTFAVVAAG